LQIRLLTYSYRFAEQVLHSKLYLKKELENVLLDPSIDVSKLSRPAFNALLRESLVPRGWEDQPAVFDDPGDPGAKMDFLKERVGVEVGFGHASFLGIDLLKFQTASYSALDKIDVGVYVVTTHRFQKYVKATYGLNWEGSLTYEKVIRYLPYFKSAIQVPIYVVGVDL
jgi:hypothetical protein